VSRVCAGSLQSNQPISLKLVMIWADKTDELINFWTGDNQIPDHFFISLTIACCSDPADIQVRVRINPEI